MFECASDSRTAPDPVLSSSASQSRPTHSIEHGGPSQERDLRVREECEQFAAQILRHQCVVARERNACVLSRAAGLQRERREVQPNWPSFGPLEQLFHLGVGELHARGGRAARAPRVPSSRGRRHRPPRCRRRHEGGPRATAVRRASRAQAASRPGGGVRARRSCRGTRRCAATRRGRGRGRRAASFLTWQPRRVKRRWPPSDGRP